MALIERTYTFDNFIVGPCNRAAYAACMAVLKEPSSRYNPLYLYGETGTGKTHLLKAMSAKLPSIGMEGIFLSGRRAYGDSLPRFLQERIPFPARGPDFLFIDDLQDILEYRESTRALLFLLESLEALQSQIVVSSDLPPAFVRKGEATSLMRRLSEGPVVKLSRLTEETRRSMITHETNKRNIQLGESSLSLLAGFPLRNYSQVRMVITRLAEIAAGASRIDEEAIARCLSRMVRHGELEIPEGASPPVIRSEAHDAEIPRERVAERMGAEERGSPQSMATGRGGTLDRSPGQVPERSPERAPDRGPTQAPALSPEQAPGAPERDYLDELEEKFSHLEREVAKEIERAGPEGETTDAKTGSMTESKGGGTSGLIEEWEAEEERLIEEE